MNNFKIIMALDSAGGFAKNNTIPWIDSQGKNKYPRDFKHFKKITSGSICVMGRKTYEDMVNIYKLRNQKIKDSILPGRKCYVLSKTGNFNIEGVEHALSIRQVYEKESKHNIFILGGERIVIDNLSSVNEIFLTVLKENYNCDKMFPLNYLKKYFTIDHGEEHKNLYFLRYRRTSQ